MKLAWTMWLVTSVVTARVEGEDVPECQNMTQDDLHQLQELTVTEDIHDKLVGESVEVWGRSNIYKPDASTRMYYKREKIDDKNLAQFAHFEGQWFDGKQSMNGTLEKVQNGVYLMKSDKGLILSKIYMLYAENGVLAYFSCLTKTPPPNSKLAELTTVSGVTVKEEHLQSSVLKPRVRESVDQAVDKVNGAQELLGEIVRVWPVMM